MSGKILFHFRDLWPEPLGSYGVFNAVVVPRRNHAMPVQPAFAHMRRIESAARLTMGDALASNYGASDRTVLAARLRRLALLPLFLLAATAATGALIYLN